MTWLPQRQNRTMSVTLIIQHSFEKQEQHQSENELFIEQEKTRLPQLSPN